MYVARGSYQFQVDQIEYAGEGVLLKNFEDLKKRLTEEGIFDAEHKKIIPKLIKNIAVITSPNGAVIQDIKNVLSRRAPLMKVYLIPSLVQGEGSEINLIDSFEKILKLHKKEKIDVVVIARGGGSLEDLWSFNSEKLARKIHEFKIPVISAIGHETDFTICDFVSDLRAPTPSAAAEIISESYLETQTNLKETFESLVNTLRNKISNSNNNLKILNKSLINPRTKLLQVHQKLDSFENLLSIIAKKILTKLRSDISLTYSELSKYNPAQKILISKQEIKSNQGMLEKNIQSSIELKKGKFSRLIGEMNSLSPLNVLSRWY